VPGGKAGRKPERAVINYCNLIKARFKDVPIVIGGIEASMRRIVHYDFWDNRLRRSIIEDSRADIIAYGMAEAAVIDIADRLAAGRPLDGIQGTVILSKKPPENSIRLPSEEETMNDRDALLSAYRAFFQNQDRIITQPAGNRFLVQFPQTLMTVQQLDGLYDLPFMYAPHSSYTEKIPAFEMIMGSITAHRGCVSGCSFCSVGLHQGKRIIARSPESVLDEAERLSRNSLFRKHITDIGGPSANMYSFSCVSGWKCSRTSCLDPRPCKMLSVQTVPWLGLIDRASSIKGISKVTVGSGIRYDVFMNDREAIPNLRKLVKNHISGHLKIAPEHTVHHVLSTMRKCPSFSLKDFVSLFRAETGRLGKKQYVLPYLMSCHPGCTMNDMQTMKNDIMKIFSYIPEQVQAFIPLPLTLSSIQFFTGIDPLTGNSVSTDKNHDKRRLQHSVIIKPSLNKK
jgi:uncharacterized radical SAM protein YgiQ